MSIRDGLDNLRTDAKTAEAEKAEEKRHSIFSNLSNAGYKSYMQFINMRDMAMMRTFAEHEEKLAKEKRDAEVRKNEERQAKADRLVGAVDKMNLMDENEFD